MGGSNEWLWRVLPAGEAADGTARLDRRAAACGCGGRCRRRHPPPSRLARSEGSGATVTVRPESQIDRQGDRRLFPRAWSPAAAVLRRCRGASAPQLAGPHSSVPRRRGRRRGDRSGEAVGRSGRRGGGGGDGCDLPLPVVAGSRRHDHLPSRRLPERARPPRSIGDARRSCQRRSDYDCRDRGARGEGDAVDGRR